MKRILVLLLITIFVLLGCNDNNQHDSNSTGNSEGTINNAVDFNYMWTDEYIDNKNNISKDVINNTKVFYDGEYLTEEKELKARNDVKYEFYSDDKLRFVNSSEGYALTFPTKNVSIDYSLSDYRVQLTFEDSILSASFEDSNPYGNTLGAWHTYHTEWLDRYISNEKYLGSKSYEGSNFSNNLSYTENPIDSTTILPGYQVIVYSIVINDNENIARPYYNVGIIRNEKIFNKFYLYVMKSKNNENNMFMDLIKSFKEVEKFGTSEVHVGQYELKANPNWNAETKAYYEKLNQQSTFEFGFFNYSLNDNDDKDGSITKKLGDEIARMESLTDYKQSILPTYNHLYWYETPFTFPTKLANLYGGGNGFDDKAVLQFTLQYTTNNNKVGSWNNSEDNYTPMFDILRGKYDELFRELARDIKDYKKPVLFRLNNEMNTDWTSYCGMMTLIDPDIFQYTWIHLYNIFEEEGVDNCIWIFNPIAVTCPYSSWGEDLCYMPGIDYVQALGITRYEMMNDDVETLSFKEGYTLLFKKNQNYWMNYPWIISEFGCASGGEITEAGIRTELFRNKLAQAQWVTEMFECLKDKEKNKFCSKISAAVWFNCNDVVSDEYGNTLIMNALRLDSSLSETFEALKEGLKHFN